MVRHLLVPGRGIPKPEHWQRRWADAHPDYRWAPFPLRQGSDLRAARRHSGRTQAANPPFTLDDRVAALDAAIRADDEPAVLIAHSAGCLAVVAWAQRHTGPVRGALLVTPPYLDPQWRPSPGEVSDAAFGVVPRQPLPFRAVLVASRTDPYTTFGQFEQYAKDWRADLFDAGDAGHIETASGYGPWPEGEKLVGSL